MMRRSGVRVLLIGSLLAGGCASRGPFDEWTEMDMAEFRRLHHSYDGAATVGGTGTDDAVQELSEQTSVVDYVRLALERNPAIQEARQRVAAALAEVPQVTSLKDPMLMLSPFGEMAQTAAGEVGLMTSLSQELPFPGKLDARGETALADARAVGATLAEVRLRVIRETRQAYWTYYDAHKSLEVTEQSRALLEQFLDAARAAYAAGTAAQQDVLRASVEVSELENDLITLRQRLEAAQGRINALIDRRVDAPLPPPLAAELQPIQLRLDRLLALAEKTNPEIARIRQEVVAARAQLRLAKLQRWPDLNVGLSYNVVEDQGLASSATGDDQWWLTLGVNLPIWNERYEAAENQARHEILAELADLHRAHNHHAAHLQELLVDLEAQQRLVILFRDTLIPQSRQTLDASLSAYRAGDVEFLNVVDNWQRLLNYQQLYYRSLAALEQAFASIEEVVGQELPRQPVGPEQPDKAEYDPQPAAQPADLETEPNQ